MTERWIVGCAALVAALSMTSVAQAALVDRGGGMIYDDVLDVTWLQNANQGAGSSYDNGASTTDGLMTWDNAKAWAEDLVFGGFDNWRLPTIVDTGFTGCDFAFTGTDCGFNVQTASGATVYSEMAHLWYVTLGNKAFFSTSGISPQPGWGFSNTGPFTNSQAYIYWSGTEFAPAPIDVWVFDTNDGSQGLTISFDYFYAWAVRDGDVGADVPLPAAAWLLLSGLGGLGVMARRLRVRR